MVDAPSQRATFAGALADALAAGYSGIRVAADNTPLVTDEARLAAWIRWEIVADRFMSENQVTGLCAFDQEKVNVDQLRHLATLRPLSSAASPVPQFRLFADSGELHIEGEIDSFAVSQVWLALKTLAAQDRRADRPGEREAPEPRGAGRPRAALRGWRGCHHPWRPGRPQPAGCFRAADRRSRHLQFDDPGRA